MEQAHMHIASKREMIEDTAEKANDAVSQFTEKNARKLRGVIDKLSPDQPEEAIE